ncbi:MAG TPA: hypothetical protein VLA89_12840 [Gemmatimonadales bacterium]|nr:hypothetical protein [Gemmatimonadales bacterium]
MATATFTWNAWDTTNAWENLADAANSASVTYSRDATDVAAKFVQATKSTTQTEFGRKAGAGDTWASIFGLGAGDTVTQVQVSAWTKKLVANTKLTSHTVTIGFIDDAGSRVTAADSISGVSLGTTVDGSYVAQSAGSAVAVNAGSQASSTSVRLSLEYTVTTSAGGGAASVDQRFDGLQVTVTYTPGVTNTPIADSESASLAEFIPGPELGVTEASSYLEAVAQTDFTVLALGSLVDTAGFVELASEAGSLGESSTIAVGPPGNDSLSLADTGSLAATSATADTGTLAETPSIAATLGDTDSGTLAPGAGANDTPAATDTAVLAETPSITATQADTDTGALVDSPALAVASSDAGTLAEATQVTTGAVAKSDTDAGAEAESAAIAIVPTGEALTQTDTGLITATLPSSDSASLAETSAIVQQGTHPADGDTGTLTETQSVPATLTDRDSATATESPLIAATPVATDIQALAESGSNAAAGTGADTGTTVDASRITAALSSADSAALTDTGAVTTPRPTDTESAVLAETATLSQAQVGVSAPPPVSIGGGGFGAILRRIKERKPEDDIEVIWAELVPPPQNEPSAAPADDTEIAPAEHAARTALPTPARLRPRVRVRRRHVPVAFELAGTSWVPDDDLARQVADDQDLVTLLALV